MHLFNSAVSLPLDLIAELFLSLDKTRVAVGSFERARSDALETIKVQLKNQAKSDDRENRKMTKNERACFAYLTLKALVLGLLEEVGQYVFDKLGWVVDLKGATIRVPRDNVLVSVCLDSFQHLIQLDWEWNGWYACALSGRDTLGGLQLGKVKVLEEDSHDEKCFEL